MHEGRRRRHEPEKPHILSLEGADFCLLLFYPVPKVPLLHPCLALGLEHTAHGAGNVPSPCTLLKAISHAQSDMEKES